MPMNPENAAALDAMLASEQGPGPGPGIPGGDAPGAVECQVCLNVIDQMTGIPVEGAMAAPAEAEAGGVPLDVGLA